jgi:hypothetical protein
MPTPNFPDSAEGPLVFHIQDFSGINTNAPRPGIADNEFSFLKNYFPIGQGNMRTLWSNGSVVYTAPTGKTIVYYYFFNIATVQQCAVFLSDGTAVQVNPNTSATVTISSATNQFYSGGYLPMAVQWNAAGILIVCESQNPNGYFAWDGTTLYGPGSAAPNWLTDQTPTVMPSGIHGNAIEVYQNRAWVTTPPETGGIPSIISQSGPGNGATFSGGSGGGSTPQQDSSLRASFMAVKQCNGFLYYLGDSSIGVISNPQTSGGLTTYSNQNVDPQTGTIWPGSVQQFSSVLGVGIMFANPQGVFLCVGGVAGKVSDDLNGIFANADFSFTPTAAIAVIFGIRVYSLLIKSIDQNGNPAIYMCMTDGKPKGDGFRWWLGDQDRTLSLIATNEFNSNIQAWGSDGTHLFQCFASPSLTLNKVLQTKFFTGKSPVEYIVYKKTLRFYFLAKDNSGTGVGFTGTYDGAAASTPVTLNSTGNNTLSWVNATGGIYNFTNASSQIFYFVVSSFVVPYTDADCYGLLLGWTFTSTNSDFTIIAQTMLYSLDSPLGG